MPIKSNDLQYELHQTAGVFGRLKETNLIFEGTDAYTDGKNIVLPAMPGGVDISDKDAMILRGYLDHEAGHIRHSDFKYLKEVLDKGISQTLKDAWNSTEDLRMEQRVIEEYPGSKKNLAELAASVNQKEYDFLTSGKVDYKEINAANVTCAVRAAGRMNRSATTITKELFELFPEQVQKWGKHFAERSIACENDKQALNVAMDILKLLKEDPELKQDPPPMPESEEEGNPEGDSKEKEMTPQEAKEAAEAIGEGGDPDKPREYRDGAKGKDKKGGKPKAQELSELMQPSTVAEGILGGSGTTFGWAGTSGAKPYLVVTDRLDETLHRSKPAKTSNALHSRMTSASPAKYENIKAKIGGEVNTMKARLKRALAAKELRDWDFGRAEGHIDSKRLVSAKLGAENVYKKRADRLELDTAVHMLIDLSGSMDGEKMDVAADCAIAFSECLEGSPIRYQVSGFSNNFSGYRPPEVDLPYYSRIEPLQTYVFKSFNESLHQAKPAMACLPEAAGGNNSDADAVYWAYNQLKNQPNKRKVLMVFSDGQPANRTSGVGYDHLNHHLKEAIKYVESKGVEVIGIGIHTGHVKRLYNNAVEIKNLSDLAGAMFNKLANALIQGKVKL